VTEDEQKTLTRLSQLASLFATAITTTAKPLMKEGWDCPFCGEADVHGTPCVVTLAASWLDGPGKELE
jgi:hypothetical protein